MFIAKMTIKEGEAPPFSEQVDFKFDEHVNVFVGPNAVGKSTLLQKVLDNHLREWPDSNVSHGKEPELSYINHQPVYLISSDHCAFALEDDDTPHMHNFDLIVVPATRVRYASGYEEDGLSVGQVTDSESHTPYGVASLSEVLYEDYIHRAVMAMYRLVEGKVDSIGEDYEKFHSHHYDIFEDDPKLAGESLKKALEVAHKCAKSICREVIIGDKPVDRRLIQDVASESTLPSAEVHFELGIRIQTNDKQVGRRVDPLDVTSLSAGTEGTLWWTRLIALSLLLMHDFNPRWEKRRAILLIDEIENHLHPTWQRRVIPALLEHFPGLQIFATTHSPFVVAGLKAGQVHLLNRDENGVVTASTNTEDIEGWTVDEILRVYMGVEEPTDETTAQAARELRLLRDEAPRADEREEEERQAEILRLRQIVDRSELSGPRAAEDARFLADLRSILHRYDQEQNLNQENG